MPTLLESIGTRIVQSKLGKLFKSESAPCIRKVIYRGKEYPVKSAHWTRDGLAIEFYDSQAVSDICEGDQCQPC